MQNKRTSIGLYLRKGEYEAGGRWSVRWQEVGRLRDGAGLCTGGALYAGAAST